MNTLRASWRLFLFLGTLTWYGFPLWVRAAFGSIDWDHHQTIRQYVQNKVWPIEV